MWLNVEPSPFAILTKRERREDGSRSSSGEDTNIPTALPELLPPFTDGYYGSGYSVFATTGLPPVPVVVRPPEIGGSGVEPVGRHVVEADVRQIRERAIGRRGAIAHARPAEQDGADAGPHVRDRSRVGAEVGLVDRLVLRRAGVVQPDRGPAVGAAEPAVREADVGGGGARAHDHEPFRGTPHVGGRRARVEAGEIRTADAPIVRAARAARRGAAADDADAVAPTDAGVVGAAGRTRRVTLPATRRETLLGRAGGDEGREADDAPPTGGGDAEKLLHGHSP